MDQEACYRAHLSKDRRFDGQFFIAVSSTKIYCRPVCTARTPKRENCTFHPSAASAERLGYRPCLLCRPELAPGSAPVDSSRRLARLALLRITEGALDHAGVDDLAASLGVTARHLRRLTEEAYGASPAELAQTQRLLMAKKLLTETGLSVSEVAEAAGFGSVRRLNTLFQDRYRMTPLRLRKKAHAPGLVKLKLNYREPYATDFMREFLTNRLLPGVESVEGGKLVRSVRIGDRVGWISVTWPSGGSLEVELSESLFPAASQILARVRRLFDLDADPVSIGEALAELRPLPGLRVPGAFSPFETAVRAILGQQVSVAGARTIAGRVAESFGDRIETPFPGVTHLFPTPIQLQAAGPNAIASLGMPVSRGTTVHGLATAIVEKRVSLKAGMQLTDLTDLPGIGPWTAEYIAMRALGDPDAFPTADLGLLKALGTKDKTELQTTAEAWRPWRAYAAIHLWSTL